MKTAASADHLKLSSEIKALHSTLRQKTKKLGTKRAWQEHLQAKSKLQSYAKAMKELAMNHWELNDRKKEEANSKAQQRSRIAWTVNYCREYFLSEDLITKIRQRELRLLDELQIDCTEMNRVIAARQVPVEKIKLLDVGSCYNPFKPFPEFEVTAVDIAPAIEEVFECDFLNVELGDSIETSSNDSKSQILSKLRINSYDVVVFSLLLEYLPTSEQRLKCCEKACKLLTDEGILCIITPDSKHMGCNVKLMKTWRYALAQLGLGRIKIEKLEHITCMVFRKCLDPEISLRWSRMHKQPYMEYCIEIPQDFNDTGDKDSEDVTEVDDESKESHDEGKEKDDDVEGKDDKEEATSQSSNELATPSEENPGPSSTTPENNCLT
ncbi:S-adenosylmethionine sensor upstream of mTORC1 [Sitodiplosis mosellana]|uniref:S-adenosylmethionine sensor upstream of mTORC1 n=1 Tax=Sitodiplosis mosellana TaxID=263140 RepID=UPI0024439B8F|nr:S-adenosylmethionine sensor upstream of mTORC1 [Sitodiplosis mosellana]